MTAVARLRQGIRALMAFTQTVDYDLAAVYLSPAQLALFRRTQRSEQLHGLNVLRAVLTQRDSTPHDLAVAALLHDVGKSRYPLAVWEKSLPVIVRKLLPGVYARCSAASPARIWCRPFVVVKHHPEWSAELVVQTGVSERVRWLIAHHADPLDDWHGHPDMALLARLKQADDAN